MRASAIVSPPTQFRQGLKADRTYLAYANAWLSAALLVFVPVAAAVVNIDEGEANSSQTGLPRITLRGRVLERGT